MVLGRPHPGGGRRLSTANRDTPKVEMLALVIARGNELKVSPLERPAQS